MRPRLLCSALVAAGTALTLPALWSATAAAAPAPPGNNGTVKVEGEAMDRLHDNDPHVGCQFFIQWYGFDEGSRTSTVTFAAQAPTGSGETLTTDTVTFDGHGSGNVLDHQESYDLTSALAGRESAHEGFHVKLTVATDGSHGANEKHKVFWVSGCGEGAGRPATATEGESESIDSSSSDVTPQPSTAVSPTGTAATPATGTTGAPATGTAVLGIMVSPPEVEATSVMAAVPTLVPTVEGTAVTRPPAARAALPRTGASGTAVLAACGLGLVVIGSGLRRAGRRHTA